MVSISENLPLSDPEKSCSRPKFRSHFSATSTILSHTRCSKIHSRSTLSFMKKKTILQTVQKNDLERSVFANLNGLPQRVNLLP